MSNCTLVSNSAGNLGGGIYNTVSSSPIVTNFILWANMNAGAGESAQIHVDSGDPTVEFSNIEGGWTGSGGTGNIDEDPLFVDPLNGDFHLQFP